MGRRAWASRNVSAIVLVREMETRRGELRGFLLVFSFSFLIVLVLLVVVLVVLVTRPTLIGLIFFLVFTVLDVRASLVRRAGSFLAQSWYACRFWMRA